MGEEKIKNMINPKFQNLLDDESVVFTVILGSGFHREALGDHSILSDWKALLSKLGNSDYVSGNFILDFEKNVLTQTLKNIQDKSLQAHEVEKKELAILVDAIKKEQEWILNNSDRFSYPELFKTNRISDVISLNFDTVAEKLLKGPRKKTHFLNQSSFHIKTKSDKLSDSFITRNTSFEEVDNSNGGIVRFWHPHGTIDNSKHIVLGLSKYAKLVSSTLTIRDHYKAVENNGSNREITWFSQIYNNPVLILGASMSQMEWAMWTAIVHRCRNFAKSENKEYEYGIFQMQQDVDIKGKHNDWFEPLFYNMSFKEQWEKLETIFQN